MKWSLSVVALAVLTLAASGCAASPRASKPPASSPATGLVTGTLGIQGGALNTGMGTRCHCQAEAGTVRLTSADGHRIRVTTNKSGKFSVRVPAGRYWIVAGLKWPYHWPMGSCKGLSGADARYDPGKGSSSVVVAAGHSLHLVVGCEAL